MDKWSNATMVTDCHNHTKLYKYGCVKIIRYHREGCMAAWEWQGTWTWIIRLGKQKREKNDYLTKCKKQNYCMG